MSSSDLDDAVQWLRANDPALIELNLQCRWRRSDGAYNKKIRAAGALRLAEAVAVNSTMVTLDLTGNEVGDQGALSLADALACNRTLSTLLLGYNELKDAGAGEIARALASSSEPTLTTLDLGNNDIGHDGTSSLAAALATNCTLTELRLHNTDISDRGAQELARVASARQFCATSMLCPALTRITLQPGTGSQHNSGRALVGRERHPRRWCRCASAGPPLACSSARQNLLSQGPAPGASGLAAWVDSPLSTAMMITFEMRCPALICLWCLEMSDADLREQAASRNHTHGQRRDPAGLAR